MFFIAQYRTSSSTVLALLVVFNVKLSENEATSSIGSISTPAFGFVRLSSWYDSEIETGNKSTNVCP